MIKDVISAKLKSLSKDKEGMVIPVLIGMCGDKVGQMKYVPIDNLDPKGFDKRCLGVNEDLYIDCVIDTLSVISAMGITDNVFLVNEQHSLIARSFKLNVKGIVGRNEILSNWSKELMLEGIDLDYKEDEEVDGYEKDDDEDKEDEDIGEIEVYEEDENLKYANEKDSELGNSSSNDEDENEGNETSRDTNEEVLREEIQKVFNITNFVSKILKRYDLQFESGYDLERPYGLVTNEGVIYTDSSKMLKLRENPKVDLSFSSVNNLNELFSNKIGYFESDARIYSDISKDLLEGYNSDNGKTLCYFPYKLLEYAYGRNSTKKNTKVYNFATYKGKGVTSNWSEFSKKVTEDIKITIEDAIVIYCLYVLNTGYDKDNIRSIIRSANTIKEIQRYIDYVCDSLSLCVMINQYKCIDGNPVSIKMRVCDPTGSLKNVTTDEIISLAFSGNTGGSKGLTLKSSLNSVDSQHYGLFEFNHEFNHKLSNAMPLFAYKAYEKLQEKGEKVSYKNLILGQCEDGTILRNGTHGVKLSEHLVHYISAGSRSGKGVMTLNLIAGALMNGKALFYLDNKPDMVSILAKLAGGVENGNPKGINFFGVNGSNFGDPNESDIQRQFVNIDSWINLDNIPQEARNVFGEDVVWRGSLYGDIFYMRAYVLAFSIIMARGLCGKSTDSKYNGTDGIFLVCDETTVLQKNFKNICSKISDMIPPQASYFPVKCSELKNLYKEKSGDKTKNSASTKYDSALTGFEVAFNSSKFYALSFLNYLYDNVSFISNKRRAAWNPIEEGYSDIVIIGQELETKPMPEDMLKAAVSSDRIARDGTKGLGKSESAKNLKESAYSIPFAHFLFGKSDAMIGYTCDHENYLKQGDISSKAHGKLDWVANNFCYIPTFNVGDGENSPAPSELLTKDVANASTTVYFKPYLILNSYDNPFLSQMEKRINDAGITTSELINEYTDDGTTLSKKVAFPEYIALAGVDDISQLLRKSADIANYVVRDILKYPDDGSGREIWLQFITDLRPEWLLSLRDIVGMCAGSFKDTNISKGINNPITKEYNEYVKFVIENKELGIVDNCISENTNLYVDEDGNTQYDVTGYESKSRKDFDASDDCSNFKNEEKEYNQRVEGIFDSNDKVSNVEDIFDESSFFGFEDNISNTESAFSGSSSENVISDMEVKKIIDEKDVIIAELLNKLKENNVNVDDYKLANEGVDEGYSANDNYSEFTFNDVNNMNVDEDGSLSADSFATLISIITSKVIDTYGGYDRISSFRVVGGSIVINETIFRSKISKECLNMLPLDIRRKVNAGNLADLFNYRELYNMSNLRNLEFDSVSFVEDTVSCELGFDYCISVDSFFKNIKCLQNLKIGKYVFSVNNYKKLTEDNDLFHYQSNATMYANACNKKLSKITKNSWSFTKNMFSSRNHGIVVKTLGVLVGGAATVVTGTAAVTSKAVNAVSKKVDKKRSLGDKAKSGFRSLKESLNDLFKN